MSIEQTNAHENSIAQRELSGVEVTEVDAKQGSFLVRAPEEEGVELLKRLIQSHYQGRQVPINYWLNQLRGIVRQLERERLSDQWSSDYVVILYDDPRREGPGREPGWALDVHAVTGGKVGITCRRSGNDPGWLFTSWDRYTPQRGKQLIDAMQEKILQAMQAR